MTTFIIPIYNLHTIRKAYQVEFHSVRNENYWSTYTWPNFIPEPHMRRKNSGRPITTRLHNEMDQSIQNKTKNILTVAMKVTTEEIVHLDSRVSLCNVVLIKYFNIIFF